MISSNTLENTLYKTLNYSQQQYKETEEIVENNPGIVLPISHYESNNTNSTSNDPPPIFFSTSNNNKALTYNNEKRSQSSKKSYTNKGFDRTNDNFTSHNVK